MEQNVTVSLPEKISSDLSKSQIVRDALQDLFSSKSSALKSKMMAKAQVQGLFTDDDVFEKVS